MPKAKTKTSVVKATVKTKSPRKVIKRSTVQNTKVEIVKKSRSNQFLVTLFFLFLASFGVYVYFFFLA